MEALIVGLIVFVALCLIAARVIIDRINKASLAARPEIGLGRNLPGDKPVQPPFTVRRDFFSGAEQSLYEMLCRLCPGHTVFAKVRLADLVHVQASGRDFWQRFNSICGKHVDFVLCDERLAPVVAIELHDDGEKLKRDAFVDTVLNTASLPIVHVRAKRGYVLDEIRQLLAPHLRIDSASVSESAEATYLPAQS